MTDLQGLLDHHVDTGTLPGAVALVADGDRVEVATAGHHDRTGTTPMSRDSIFRIASLTKPITAAAVLVLVDDGTLALTDPIGRWLPELASPMVVRTPASPVDDVVPVARPITVYDLLTSQAGWGWAADFDLPAVRALSAVQRDGREPQTFPSTDRWLADLGQVPMLYQPGESFLYDTCSAIQGALVERVAGSFPDFLAERVFAPLSMVDSGFAVSATDRFTSYYKGDELADGPDGQWATMPAFPLGSGGLAGTVDDWLAFARMLLAGGQPVLSAESVRLMTTDHTTAAQREIGAMFLQGQGWGMGGSVDIAPIESWTVPGRYGWVGGTGTTAYLVPSTGRVTILYTQLATDGPEPPEWLFDFWRLTQ